MRAVPATGVSCPQLLIYYLPQTPVVEVLCKNSRMPSDLMCALCSTCGCKPLCNRQCLPICFPFIFEGLWIPPLNSSSGGYGALGTHWKHAPLHFCAKRSGEMTVLNHVFEQDQVNKKINIISSLFPRNLPYPFYCQQLGTGREVTSEMRGLQTPNLEFPFSLFTWIQAFIRRLPATWYITSQAI